MKREINIKPIKREFKNKANKSKVNWTCNLEVVKFNGTTNIIEGIQFMKTQTLKRDAIKKATEYKKYLLTKGNFYFI